MVFPGTLPRDFAQGLCPGHFTQHIAYDIVYDIVYNIVYDIVYNIVYDIVYNIVYDIIYYIIYDMLCTCNTPSSIPFGGNEKLSCSTKIGAVKLSDRPRGGLHTWLVRRRCLWTTTTAVV